MEYQTIFNILIIIILILILYKISKPKYDNFTELSEQDIEGLQNLSSMYKDGELKISKLHVTDDALFDKKITSEDLLVNKKITSEDLDINNLSSTKRLDIKNKSGLITQFNFNDTGQNYIKHGITVDGDINTNERISSKNLYVIDNSTTKSLEIRNDEIGNTYFNKNNEQINYIEGRNIFKSKDNDIYIKKKSEMRNHFEYLQPGELTIATFNDKSKIKFLGNEHEIGEFNNGDVVGFVSKSIDSTRQNNKYKLHYFGKKGDDWNGGIEEL